MGLRHAIEEVRIFRSRILTTGEGGGIDYEPLNSWKYDASEWMTVVTGQMARSWYCGWSPPIGVGISRERISPELVRNCASWMNQAVSLQKYFRKRELRHAVGTASFTIEIRSRHVPEDRNELRGIAQKLFELEKLAEKVGETDENLKPLTLMLKVMMHNLRGSQLSELGLEAPSLMDNWPMESKSSGVGSSRLVTCLDLFRSGAVVQAIGPTNVGGGVE